MTRSEQARHAALVYWSRLSPRERSIKNRAVSAMRQRRPLAERFAAKVRKTRGCWLWTGSVDGGGYGEIMAEGVRKNLKAHRVAYALWVGPIGRLHVLHDCDRPSCVRPDHLWLGTHQDNMLDMIRKGRRQAARGERTAHAKLTRAKVVMVRKLRARGWSQQRIADRYGVSQVAVSCVLRGRTWTWA